MVKNVFDAPRLTAISPAPALAAAALVAFAVTATFGWIAYSDGIYLTMIDGLLAWCL